MSNENAERLAAALVSLKYVEPINLEETQHGTCNILCRINPQKLTDWAKVVETILRREERAGRWHSHICRLYMLKNDMLVYGWLVSITSPGMPDALDEIIPIIKSYSPRPKPVPRRRVPQPQRASSPVVHRAKPEADAKGNPIVPPNHRVSEVPMAGLHPRFDRNAPSEETEGRGAYGMFKSKRWGSAFKPPKTR